MLNDVADHGIFDVLLLKSISRWVNFLKTMRYFAHRLCTYNPQIKKVILYNILYFNYLF